MTPEQKQAHRRVLDSSSAILKYWTKSTHSIGRYPDPRQPLPDELQDHQAALAEYDGVELLKFLFLNRSLIAPYFV